MLDEIREWNCQICGELILATNQPEWFGVDPNKEYRHTVCAINTGVHRRAS